MVLVHGAHRGRRVHDRDASLQGIPKQPGFTSGAADDKSGDFLIVQAFVEHEIVDPLMWSLVTRFKRTLPEGFLPIRSFEIEGFANVRVPPAPRHQETIERLGESLDSRAKIAHQQDIAIDVAEPAGPRNLLSLVVYARQGFGPVLIFLAV